MSTDSGIAGARPGSSLPPAEPLPGRFPGWLNGRVFSWASYDIASSSYFSVVPPLLFPIFFLSIIATNENRYLYLSITIAVALLAAGCLAPFIGRWADVSQSRWPMLAGLTLLCCLATASLCLVGPGDAFMAANLFAIAQASYLLATPLYESFLPSIAPAAETGRVSGFGWALGFFGGIAAIVLILPFARDSPDSNAVDVFRIGFLIVATIFLVVSIPALIGLRRAYMPTRDVRDAPQAPSVWRTLRQWRENREIFKFILAFYLINDAIVTVTFFTAALLRSHFGATLEDLLILLLFFHVIAVPATLIFGFLADRWSHRKAIGLSLIIWISVPTILIFGRGDWVPVTIVILLGLVTGSTQAMLRSMLAQLVPRHRAAEFFGFNTFAGRVSAAIGPLLYGLVTTITGDERAGFASVFVFIIAGAIVLSRVRPPARVDHDSTAQA